MCDRFSKKRTKPEDGEIRDSNEEDNGQPHPLVSVTKIDPDEIPEVPANKFLYRAGPTNNANQKEFRQHYGRDRIRSHRKTGRIFKGRGIFVSTCTDIFVLDETLKKIRAYSIGYILNKISAISYALSESFQKCDAASLEASSKSHH